MPLLAELMKIFNEARTINIARLAALKILPF